MDAITKSVAVTTLDRSMLGGMVTMNAKGKTGTFARAIAFAGRDERIKLGQMMHLKWLNNGQFRPLVNDILGCGLVAKAALPYVAPMIPPTGPVTKDNLIGLCRAVRSAVEFKGKDLKGEKSFIYELVRRIASEGEDKLTLDAE
jgi:hypothetical protein